MASSSITLALFDTFNKPKRVFDLPIDTSLRRTCAWALYRIILILFSPPSTRHNPAPDPLSPRRRHGGSRRRRTRSW